MYPPSMAGPAANKNEHVDYTQRFSELYFGYASNLAPSSMQGRCPDSLFCGLARLDGYKWHINESRYANIVASPNDHVYGSLFFLSPRDEAGLDVSEGVPWDYQKTYVEVERIDNDGTASGQRVPVMTYADANRTTDGPIERDYVIWITKAIREATSFGMPAEYVEKYIRPYLPATTAEEDAQEIMMVRVMHSRTAPPSAQGLQPGRRLAGDE